MEKREFSPAWIEMSCCGQVFSACRSGSSERTGGYLGDLGSALSFAGHLTLRTNASSAAVSSLPEQLQRHCHLSWKMLLRFFFWSKKMLVDDLCVYGCSWCVHKDKRWEIFVVSTKIFVFWFCLSDTKSCGRVMWSCVTCWLIVPKSNRLINRSYHKERYAGPSCNW